jgi:superfamily I DNA and RNA helicase
MSIEIIRSFMSKPAAMERLVSAFEAANLTEGTLWVGFPLLSDSTSTFSVDALFLSQAHGMVVFDVVEGANLGDFAARQDDLSRLVQAKLLREKALSRKGQVLVPISTCTFAPALLAAGVADARESEPDYELLTINDVDQHLANVIRQQLVDVALVQRAKSALQNMSNLRKRSFRRHVERVDSRGAKLQRLEESIATLDKSQTEAVLQVPDGVQRIRGLAGSGKTVVLARKAAYLHSLHPDWRIAVTFNVRALKQQFLSLIEEFVIGETGEAPDWGKVQVINSWGSPSSRAGTGIYAEFCKANGVEYQDFRTAEGRYGGQSAFEEICKLALGQVAEPVPVYDVILVDEAQDFSPSFLRLCYELLDEKKRLVYAYDELQNVSSQGMPSPEEIFGHDETGKPRVNFNEIGRTSARRDILLERCYRNSRPLLSTAHAFGFGIYREAPSNATTGLVQMFDQPSLWADIGYEVFNGRLEDNADVTLSRTEHSSPLFLENHSDLSDLISVESFKTSEEQYEWVAEQIRRNLYEDELKPNDIMIVNPDPITARKNFGPLRNLLLDLGINTHLAGVDTSSDSFFSADEKSVTCTGIYRAKGNEAGMVYVINAHEGQASTYNLALIRNRLFTAVTRSKAWVRVTGLDPNMSILTSEFNRIKAEEFALRFRYPTASEREKLRIVHRELSGHQQKVVKSSDRTARELLKSLTDGNVHVEDLDEAVRLKLLQVLGESDA